MTEIQSEESLLKEKTLDVLKNVKDPELGLDVVFLGLIRGLEFKKQSDEKFSVIIKLTLTSPSCPYAGQMVDHVKTVVSQLDFVQDVQISLELIPPWEPPEEVKELFGWS
ncbi:MAG: metal-sulfur cluster assembly factor [Deltaproteobacteria bacterium]|nr:metal-sulfur cluster assembly factor [Deltaproteobacteria bacterium]MCX7952813.1 metal-sulfur cluster assembly factor [Deltaproteobacteria bacterium]